MDTGVLIAAWAGEDALKKAARRVLEDENRFFVASLFLKLETLPKATHRGSRGEVDFLDYAFSLIREWVAIDEALIERAIKLGKEYGVMNIDAIHAASAEVAGVGQFVTTELATKPFYKVPQIHAIHVTNAAL